MGRMKDLHTILGEAVTSIVQLAIQQHYRGNAEVAPIPRDLAQDWHNGGLLHDSRECWDCGEVVLPVPTQEHDTVRYLVHLHTFKIVCAPAVVVAP